MVKKGEGDLTFQSAAKHKGTPIFYFYHKWLYSKCVVVSNIVVLG